MLTYTADKSNILQKADNGKINTFHRIAWLVIYALIVQSLITGNSGLMNLTVCGAIAYSLFASAECVIILLCGLSMYEAVFFLSGNNAWFILLLIFVAKMLFRKGMHMNIITFFACLIVACMEFALEFTQTSMGYIVVNITCIIFAFTAFSNLDNLNIDVYDIICAMSFAFLGVVYYVFTMDGGIGEFMNSFMSSTYAYRFGRGYGDTVGGAMAIPLYAAMLIACCASFAVLRKNKSTYQLIFITAVSLIALIVGAMTISRSFYLCVLVSLALFFVFKSENGRTVKIGIATVVILASIIFILMETELIDKIFANLQMRMNNGMEEGSEGRFDIWVSCISYLLNNPLRMLCGYGATAYPAIGASLNEIFSAGSHNLLIDLMMSWGILGTLLIVSVCLIALKKIICSTKKFQKHSLLPLCTYIIFSLTALRCCNLKTWMFLLVGYIFVMQLNKEEGL